MPGNPFENINRATERMKVEKKEASETPESSSLLQPNRTRITVIIVRVLNLLIVSMHQFKNRFTIQISL